MRTNNLKLILGLLGFFSLLGCNASSQSKYSLELRAIGADALELDAFNKIATSDAVIAQLDARCGTAETPLTEIVTFASEDSNRISVRIDNPTPENVARLMAWLDEIQEHSSALRAEIDNAEESKAQLQQELLNARDQLAQTELDAEPRNWEQLRMELQSAFEEKRFDVDAAVGFVSNVADDSSSNYSSWKNALTAAISDTELSPVVTLTMEVDSSLGGFSEEAIGELRLLEARLAKFERANFGEEHPSVKKIKKQLAAVKKTEREAVKVRQSNPFGSVREPQSEKFEQVISAVDNRIALSQELLDTQVVAREKLEEKISSLESQLSEAEEIMSEPVFGVEVVEFPKLPFSSKALAKFKTLKQEFGLAE